MKTKKGYFAEKKHEFHGRVGTRAYSSYRNMKKRCCNPKSSQYSWYGARGIMVCDRWMASFLAFLEDMGEPPTEQHTIDRIDPNGHYEPGNCRWATVQQQTENKRLPKFARRITWNGETKTVTEWAAHLGMRRHTLYMRLNCGWSIEDALTKPAHMGMSPGGWRALNPDAQVCVFDTPGMLTFQGETMTVLEWSKKLGLSRTAIYLRMRKGLPIEQILRPGKMTPGPKKAA